MARNLVGGKKLKELDFYFDFGSPTAFLANVRLQQLRSKYGITVNFYPVLLGGIFKATGNSSPATVPAKGQYMQKHDLPRFARKYGVPLNFNPHFPINTHQLMRAATAMYEDVNFEIFINCIFKSIWIDGLNMGDERVVESVLIQIKLNSTKILEQIKTDEVKQTLIKKTEKAINIGLFGVPTIFVGDEMFFGQDRLDFVEAILEKPIK